MVFDGSVPDGWSVYMEKNNKHVIFEHDGSGALCHVEADGMKPLTSLSEGRNTRFYRREDSFAEALTLAEGVMNVYNRGFEAEETENE